jgi:hypothetical protein
LFLPDQLFIPGFGSFAEWNRDKIAGYFVFVKGCLNPVFETEPGIRSENFRFPSLGPVL